MKDYRLYNFGALPPLPDGFFVAWFEDHEHYQAIGPGKDGCVYPEDYWESDISCNPFQCRRWAINHATRAKEIVA